MKFINNLISRTNSLSNLLVKILETQLTINENLLLISEQQECYNKQQLEIINILEKVVSGMQFLVEKSKPMTTVINQSFSALDNEDDNTKADYVIVADKHQKIINIIEDINKFLTRGR